MAKKILCGIAFNNHDSSVSFAFDDEVVLVLEAERVFRRKKMRCNAKEMEALLCIGLNTLNKSPEDVSCWALSTLQNPWIEEKDRRPNPATWMDVDILGERRKALIVNHHLSHASSFLFSPYEEATIFTCDGGGDFGERVTVYTGMSTNLIKQDFDTRNFITAKPYNLCSTYLYGYPMCEGKLMALAAYGEPNEKYISILESILPNLCTTDYERGDLLLSREFPSLKSTASPSNIKACDFAASVQEVFVRYRLRDFEEVRKKFPSKGIVLSGGACLNLEANTEMWNLFPEIFIPPFCDDTGQSLGALTYLIAEVFRTRPRTSLPYMGFGHNFTYTQETISKITELLLAENVILIHNGRAEIGPRALGNRSFLARPDKQGLKNILNLEIKGREGYRPLAPVVPLEKAKDYFYGPPSSPYMLNAYRIKPGKRELVIGTGHTDDTARAQTLERHINPFLYDLLMSFGEESGIYALINTSLNLRGEPISNTLQDTLNISSNIKYRHRIVSNGELME